MPVSDLFSGEEIGGREELQCGHVSALIWISSPKCQRIYLSGRTWLLISPPDLEPPGEPQVLKPHDDDEFVRIIIAPFLRSLPPPPRK